MHSGIYRALSILKFKIKHNINDLRDLPNFLFAFDLDQVLQAVKKLSVENGFLVRFLILPAQVQWDKSFVTQSLNRNRIGFWDFDSIVTKHYKDKYCIWIGYQGPHLNPKGHLIVGQLLAKRIKPLIH